MIKDEYSSNKIARDLGLSVLQVSKIRQEINHKLKVNNQIALIKKCVQYNIIDVQELLDKN